jgi:cyclic pyranopterin phosphate synthase
VILVFPLLQVAAAFPGGLQRLADPAGEVAKNYRVPGFVGSVSFITSMTQAFCGDCNRWGVLVGLRFPSWHVSGCPPGR